MNKRLFEDLNQDQKNLFNRIDYFLSYNPSFNLKVLYALIEKFKILEDLK